MEAFTSGKVSANARRGWLSDPLRADRNRTFEKINGGYRMIAWESEIEICRAMGRGVAAGKDQLAHRYDQKREITPAVPARFAPRW